MLIVNADDLGRQQLATDRILACHARGRLTATSAMVFMEDSERAAALALAAGIDVGLHLNFSEAFTAPAAPSSLRTAQLPICRFLRSNKYALLIYHPGLVRQFRAVFEAQCGEFVRLYRRPPSHFDGHQHFHLSTNVLLARLLPAGSKVRRSFTFRAGEKGTLNRWYRAFIDGRLARRHRLTDRFYSIAHYLSLERLQRITALAKTSNVELMTHPALPEEYDFLMGADYGRALSGVTLGTFATL